MPEVPQKIRTGLVELRTDIGPVYVSPSFWERIYLLWTFRNFPSLPKQVLNRHQRQLIDKLCRTSIVSQNAPIPRTRIIGAVENVSLRRDRKTEAAATVSKLVEMSVRSREVAAPRAVGSQGIPVGSSPAAFNRTDVGRSRRGSANVQSISAPKQDSAEKSESKQVGSAPVGSDAGRTRSRKGLWWALVAACGAPLLGILFYFREGRLALPITVPQTSVQAHQTPSQGVTSAAVAQTEKVEQSAPRERRLPAAIIALNGPSPAVSSAQHDSKHRETLILSRPPVATVDPNPAERLQVAEAPEGGIIYPVAQSPALSGKVSLKAVIGTDGTVTGVDVVSGNRALAGAAVRAVRHWRYRPYKLKGYAVEAETNIVISFVGDDVVSISFPAAH